MFTGFASENTPAIQVWDFFRTFATLSAVRSVCLADDCAPIQFFRTGGSNTTIIVQLPSAPIEGKIIKIVVNKYGTNDQKIAITTPDLSGFGALLQLFLIGPGQTIDLCYSKNCISIGTASGSPYSTGWVSLNQGSASSGNFSAINFGHSNSASSNYASSIGGTGNNSSANYSAILGGSDSTASGSRAAVVGGSSNTASGTNAAVVGGASNNVSGEVSAIVSGESNNASGVYCFIGSGYVCNATSSFASVLSGTYNTASGDSSAVLGGRNGTTRIISGSVVTSASASPIQAAAGVQQTATLVLGRQTTDATATRLTSNTSAASTTNQVILPNNSAYTFQGTCIANVTAGGTTSGWKFEGVIKRGANAASTTLVAAVTPTVIAQDAGASTWVLAITADTTNGGIKVEVTGAAATTIRWVVKIETTEVTF
jgi:hypothetical protein